MRIIYCDSVVDNTIVDPDYAREMEAANRTGFTTSLISFEELTGGNIKKAIKLVVPAETKELGVYRGWMLTPDVYAQLFERLLDKNIELINSPSEYTHCHHLPNSYEHIKSLTPKSTCSKPKMPLGDNIIFALTEEFENSPIIVKDYVKSEKHNWNDACFIPDASNKQRLLEVVHQFLQLRGSALNEGLVFREFIELEFLTEHSKSGMPLTKEFRIFFTKKEIACVFNYWDEGEYGEEKPELKTFSQIAQTIQSNFFTMDIAQTKNGDWIIMELGDGQVAGLPDNADIEKFYSSLFRLTSTKKSN